MGTEVFIKLDQVSLSVPMYIQHERQARNWASIFFGAIFDPPRRRLACLLDGISFEAKEGDRVAVLGRNGAGKSTLLKVLNGVYAPTSGHVNVQGSRQALLNISLGFNGDATVRENIFLRGTAMGLRADYLQERIASILDFAGLRGKVNHRLHTLSSGQKMRLGFSISTSVQQDILFMDEWVGAGDANFMAQAKERMQGHVGGSKIVVLASHSVGLLRDICNKGIVLEGGKLLYAGDILSSLKFYHELLATLRARGEQDLVNSDTVDQLVYGCVESITPYADGVRLDGWLASNDGSSPGYLAIESNGVVYPMTRIGRYDRPDVVRHFGLSRDQRGFRAEFVIPKLNHVTELGAQTRVLAGATPGQAITPLRLAPGVLIALRNAAPD